MKRQTPSFRNASATILLASMMLLCSTTFAFAQFGPNPQFHNSDFYIGPRVGLGGIGGAGVGLGVNAEYGITQQIGVTGTFGWSGYSSGYWTYTNLIVAVGGNYHVQVFNVKNLDTYAGLGLGWNFGSVASTDSRYVWDRSYGGFFWDLRVGGRYFISDKLAATAEFGYGFGYFRLGVDFKL